MDRGEETTVEYGQVKYAIGAIVMALALVIIN